MHSMRREWVHSATISFRAGGKNEQRDSSCLNFVEVTMLMRMRMLWIMTNEVLRADNDERSEYYGQDKDHAPSEKKKNWKELKKCAQTSIFETSHKHKLFILRFLMCAERFRSHSISTRACQRTFYCSICFDRNELNKIYEQNPDESLNWNVCTVHVMCAPIAVKRWIHISATKKIENM